MASLLRDQHWLPLVQEVAKQIVAHEPDKVLALTRRWLQQPGGDTAIRFFQS
jgi:ATP-dependent DNA helicase RecG